MSGTFTRLVIKDDKKRLVEGFANVAVTDRQNDIVPTAAMAKAMLEYMARGGILLLGHSNKPVGKVLQWGVEKAPGSNAEGIHIIAEIYQGNAVGDTAWEMLQEKRLTGFSIGGSARDMGPIPDKQAVGGMARALKEIELNEISLVEIPANQMATVESISVAKSADMDEDGRLIAKEIHRYAETKDKAERVAQELKQEKYVVYRIFDTGIEGPERFRIDAGIEENRAHGRPAPGVSDKPRKAKHEGATQRVLMTLSLGEDGKWDIESVEKREDVPLELSEEEKAEGSGTPATPETVEAEQKETKEAPTIAMEQSGNYDQSKYGLAAEKECECGGKCECHKEAEPAGKPDADAGQGMEVEKPFKSRAQQRWAFWSHQPFAQRWAHMTNFSHLPERKKGLHEEDMAEGGMGPCSYCGDEDKIIADRYGNPICGTCDEEVKALESVLSKSDEVHPIRDDSICPHCHSKMEAPRKHDPKAPNLEDYMWCPMCEEHRRVRGGKEADEEKRLEHGQEVELSAEHPAGCECEKCKGLEKKPRDGATADCNVGPSGLAGEEGLQMDIAGVKVRKWLRIAKDVPKMPKPAITAESHARRLMRIHGVGTGSSGDGGNAGKGPEKLSGLKLKKLLNKAKSRKI
jgi:HK97 family phage prohead protease